MAGENLKNLDITCQRAIFNFYLNYMPYHT